MQMINFKRTYSQNFLPSSLFSGNFLPELPIGINLDNLASSMTIERLLHTSPLSTLMAQHVPTMHVTRDNLMMAFIMLGLWNIFLIVR